MKRLLISMALCLTMVVAFAADNDTIGIDQSRIARFIEEPAVSAKGKQYFKYYAIYNGELVKTNKGVIEAVKLCDKYKAKCALAAIVNRKTKKIVRIILN